MNPLESRIAIVTGGASGIGRAIALALAAEGATVLVGDVDEPGGLETCRLIENAGGKTHFWPLDVSSEDDWKRLAAMTAEKFRSLHILVNNAAICISRPLLEMSFDSWRRQMAINLDGLFLGTKAMLPLMAESGGGSIVNLSSVAGLRGVPGMSGYCASKGGVRMFTKAVALECAQARNNIRVNSVHPGSIETPIWLKLGNGGDLLAADARRNADVMADIRAAGAAATPVGRSGTPEDVAAGVLYLVSDAARFVTGTELVIDGGVMAG
ncbi:MAG TPA: glucose 1-dehydrogenase [Rhizomicrobium sp.]|jgi:NAD(P)-dependent dehydrogenase (short-subunit alcohol dehydrogenase family)|nr:glucose 1-dehydrogenase [Rhizomicrobium sp.]